MKLSKTIFFALIFLSVNKNILAEEEIKRKSIIIISNQQKENLELCINYNTKNYEKITLGKHKDHYIYNDDKVYESIQIRNKIILIKDLHISKDHIFKITKNKVSSKMTQLGHGITSHNIDKYF